MADHQAITREEESYQEACALQLEFKQYTQTGLCVFSVGVDADRAH